MSFVRINDDSYAANENQESAISISPICAENILKDLIRKIDHNSSSYENNFDLLRKDFLELKNHLKNENNDFESWTECQQLLNNINSYIEEKNMRKLHQELIKLQKKLTLLDFEDLIDLMAKTEIAENKMKGKDVVLLVGKTGSGKSTTLHCLAGSQFRKNDENDHHEPCDFQPNLENVRTSNSSNSETRFILPVDINLDRIRRTGTITICDTPGFNDSAGAEVDIANNFGIFKAIKCCISVKLVVLISSKSLGDRYDGIIEIAELISQMIPTIPDHLSSIVYIYTKFSSNDEIKRCINEASKRDGLSDTINEILDSMYDQKPILIDPLDSDSATKALKKIYDIKKIEYPDEVFQPMTNSKAFSSLNEQIYFHERSINSAMERLNFDLIMFKLGQLKRLKFYLENVTLETTIVRIVEKLKKFFDDIYLKSWNCVTNWSNEDLNAFEQTEVKESMNFLKSSKVNKLISGYLSGEQDEKEVNYVKNLEDLICAKCLSLFEKIKGCSFDETDDETAYHCLKKLNILFLNFRWQAIEDLLKKSWKQVNCKITENSQAVSSMLEGKNFDFEKIANFLNKCKNIYTVHKKINAIDESNTIVTSIWTDYENALLVVKKYFCTETELILKTLTTKERADVEIINLFKISIFNLTAAINCSKLCLLVEKSDLSKILAKLNDKAWEKMEKSANVIFLIEENQELDNNIMDRIKMSLEEMELWLEITKDHGLLSQVKIKLSDFFVTMNSKLLGGTLDYFLHAAEEDVNFAKIKSYFEIMKSAQWLDRIKENFHFELCEKFKFNILKKLEKYEKEYKSYTLDIYSFKSIAKINKIITSIKRCEPLADIFSEISDLIIKINEDYKKNLDEVLNDVNIKLNTTGDLNYGFMELALQFLEELISNRLESQDTTRYENRKTEIKNFLMNKFEDDISNFEISFRELKDSSFVKNAEDILDDRCKKMLELFKKFLQVKKRYPTIYEHSEDIVEAWKNNLLSYHSELSGMTAILRLNQQERELDMKILICRKLSSFDCLLKTENQNLFYNLSIRFQTENLNELTQLKQKIQNLIEMKKFSHLKKELLLLNNFSVNQSILNEIRSDISSLVEETIEDIEFSEKKITKELHHQDFENLFKKVNILKQAFKWMHKDNSINVVNSNYDRVINKEVVKKIEDTFQGIKKNLLEKLENFLKNLEKVIKLNVFNQAESLREKFERIKSFLLDRVFFDDSLSKRYSDIEESLENCAVELITKYENIGIENYKQNDLKHVLEELENIKDKMAGYMNAYNRLSYHISAKIRQYLHNNEGVSLEKRISFVESLAFYLTKSINEQTRFELNESKSQLQILKDGYENEVKELIEKDDVRGICNLLNRDFAVKCDFIEVKIKDVHQFFHKKIENINSHLKRNNVEEAFVELIEIKDYFSHAKNEVIESIEERFYKRLRRLKEIFSLKYDDNDENYFQHFSTINENDLKSLFLFYKNLNDTSLESIFRNYSIRDETKMLIDRIEQLFEKNYQNVKKSLEMLDFNKTLISLKFSFNCCKIEQIAAQNQTISMSIISNKEIKSLVLDKLDVACENLFRINILNQKETKYEKDRNLFFNRIKKEFMFVKNASETCEFKKIISTEFSIKEKFEKIKNNLIDGTKNIQNKALDIIEKEELTENDCNNLRLYCENFFIIDNELSDFLYHYDLNLSIFTENFLQKCYQIAEKVFSKNFVIEESVRCLLCLKQISDNVVWIKEKIDSIIVKSITKFKAQNGGQKFLSLATHLSENEIGLFILGEYDIFKGELIRVMKEKTNRHDIDYILKEMEGDELEKKNLKKRFDNFKNQYDELVKASLLSNSQTKKIGELVSEVRRLVVRSQKQNNELIKQIPSLVAHIFAVWTLKNIHYYKEMEEVSNRDLYLLQPHPAQVIAIFRLLGIGYTHGVFKKIPFFTWSEQIPKNLVQVNTGEGKSVILAVTSIVLALAGFEVSCACYSKYLSERDYEEFKEMFELFQLEKKIFYGTFNKVCERLINKDFDLREKVIDLIKLNAEDEIEKSLDKKDKERSQVLLIDEVDVFFSEDFLGNFYIPLATLKHQCITQVLKKIWQERHQINLYQLKKTTEFKECERVFSNWMDLLKESFKDVLADLKTFESHKYKVINDKIAYMEHNVFKTNIVYGYQTLFAYFDEHERGNISSKSLNDYVGLGIQCGKFSFSEIPKQFDFIIGVSGTLKNLSKSQIDVIEKLYDIKKFTYIPSIYGKGQLQFSRESDTIVATKDDYFIRIKDELDRRISGTVNPEVKRAVLIFFENFEILSEFYKSSQMINYVQDDKVNILSEYVSINERKFFIKKATTNERITLLTRSFGRGIDFICNNKSILDNGGVHVIQTFFSEDPSEEIQIKGRTARQGEKGSFSMVLNEQDLEKFFGISYKTDLESFKTNASVYAKTDQKRNIFFNIHTQSIQESINQALSDHEQAKEFQKNLREAKLKSVKSFLIKKNLGATMTNSRSKTIVLMDATGSMGNLLNQVKNTICTMFDRAIAILSESGLASDAFEIQLAVYRDYDSLEKVLESSEWERNPLNLRNFMNNIKANGGADYPEAIEIGLWHVNQEVKRSNSTNGVSQVILIGDAPAKSFDSVKKDRERFGGETFWSKTKFNSPTFYIDELNLLKESEIPVHTFYVCTGGAEECFSQMAKETGGQTGFLDVNSSNGSDKLIDLITPLVLKNIETINCESDNQLVNAYTKKYAKSYI